MGNRREHAGGVPDSERSYGATHPVAPFDYDAVDGPPPEQMRSIEQFTDAMTELLQWIVHNGNHTPHGVYVRVMVLLFLIAPHSIGITTQKHLASRLGVSRSWVNEVVQDFVRRYGFTALHLNLAHQPRSKRLEKPHKNKGKR